MTYRRWTAAAVAAGLVAAALAWLGDPTPTRLDDATTGDRALADDVRAAVGDGDGYRGLAVALIEDGEVRYAGLGARDTDAPPDADTPFEIGSIGKALTGMLLADLAADGTVNPDRPLREVLPDGKPSDSLGDVTLSQLATHHSGLPSVRRTGVVQAVAMGARNLGGRDPYAGQDTSWLASSLTDASADPQQAEFQYSNYGFAVLGHALARHTDTPYPQLLTERILQPLGMHDTALYPDGAPPPPGRATGTTATGRPMDPWQASGYAPAGIGAWSTARDLAGMVAALLDGTAPGATAVTPRSSDGGDGQVGFAWITENVSGQEITWHNGGTGGFRSFVGFDTRTDRGVVVLGNTDREVGTLARHLLTGAPAGSGTGGAELPVIVMTVALALLGGIGLLLVVVRAGVHRLSLVSNGVWALAAPALAYPLGAWTTVPLWVWAVGVGLSATALVLAARRWLTAPVYAGRYRWLGWLGSGVSVLSAVLALAWVLI